MLNHLLTTVESIANRPNWLMSVADALMETVLPQTTAVAGNFCGCTSACKRKEWVWVQYPEHFGWRLDCIEVGGGCPPGVPC